MTDGHRSVPSSELSHILLSSEISSEIATSDQGLTAEEARRRFFRDG